ncbi:hypothetical protein GCM10025768_12550 [Microbacterium pseudoresistens]|uniref:Uncharacterized protein n=1 Tax=Microbacterium pseudoresistens TaxID=640634 RepID=A0A7Y9EWE7_9MICO|nr:hypothetical protein [Microbacterium pseudoresistens]NYD55158.1 hypothetical protein [Microbacterium pseudoresistens]
MGLAIACGVLLVTTIGLGVTAVSLAVGNPASTGGTATPTPTASDGSSGTNGRAGIVHDIPISVHSDLEFGPFAMTEPDEDAYTLLYAVITNPDSTRAAEIYFDITAYDAEGRIIDRTPTSAYLLPDQQSVFEGILPPDLSDVVEFRVEQTIGEFEPPIMTGEITLDALKGSKEGLVEGTFTSSLDAVPEYPSLYIVGHIDGEIFAVCDAMPDIPAGGSFTSRCGLVPAANGEQLVAPDDMLPDDAEFAAFLALDIPY